MFGSIYEILFYAIPVLIDWILSEEGQEIIEKCGYVRRGDMK